MCVLNELKTIRFEDVGARAYHRQYSQSYVDDFVERRMPSLLLELRRRQQQGRRGVNGYVSFREDPEEETSFSVRFFQNDPEELLEAVTDGEMDPGSLLVGTSRVDSIRYREACAVADRFTRGLLDNKMKTIGVHVTRIEEAHSNHGLYLLHFSLSW